MLIVILGCGRVGARLACSLAQEGHEVRVIDRQVEALGRLPADFPGQALVGDGIDADVLRAAGVDRADVFAAVTNDDNMNIMASQIAQVMFNVRRVVTRIYDPVREEAYQTLGLQTVCPTTLGAERIEHMLDTVGPASPPSGTAAGTGAANSGKG
jgi:trk system potassium uptake protein TrkA